MEAASGGQKGKKSVASEGQSKPKRQMKTPFQLEILEKAYAYDAYPPEDVRAELSKKLGLTDRQLQMWFCHRRLKTKREEAAKKQQVPSPAAADNETTRVSGRSREPVSVSGSDSGSGYGLGSSSFSQREARKGGSRMMGVRPMVVEDGMSMKRAYGEIVPSLAMLEPRAIALVEGQLGEPLREDGPIFGIEFDPLPPDAFGASIAISEQRRQPGLPSKYKIHERCDSTLDKVGKSSFSDYKKYQYVRHQSNIQRSDADEGVSMPHFDMSLDDSSCRSPYVQSNDLFRRRGIHSNASHDDHFLEQEEQGDIYTKSPRCHNSVLIPCLTASTNMELDAASPAVGSENLNVACDIKMPLNEEMLRMKRKHKIEGVKIPRENPAYEKRIRKELEKQDTLRRKREEQVKREMEKHEREKRKEEEKLMREKQREEERFQREQRREIARREKFMRKESLRAEKMRQKEELRREKEEARRKAASERATARRIARESMGLIDDEKLELMEQGASNKGASIYSTEGNTTQNPCSFSDTLAEFPSKSVKLKLPFTVKPWINAEENIGKLLMVWRFLITFADVLELWPFTLDEFVQAFHDCESRLLSEVHVSLLKLLIRDTEVFAKTPSIGGTNQYSTASTEGGHPLIVQGAHAWGFNICSWQQHINALTWPEMLRQFALSAGFGPQLKKKSIEPTCLNDNNEAKDSEDIICNLRNGSTAENAASMMHRKGFPPVRRSRHRLTPGTVKFAAFHVLSLEGSRGLTILELADKIQKSGLRDLTMSKAPEASIAAALSRDAKLFERTAPSTYCVRSPYRKDPADAELILSSAYEKLQIFENGFLAGEDADVLEKDEDSESEAAEGSEVDDLSTPLNDNKMVVHQTEGSASSGNGKENFPCDVFVEMQNGFDNSVKDSSFGMDDHKDVDGTNFFTDEGIGGSNPDLECMEIDESKQHEPWVEGLAEVEYSTLSVEDRLDALVALVSVVNEGKSIRTILEDRLEAANALKKQMWAEAQLDKRRVKEESIPKFQHPSLTGNNAETKSTSPIVDCCQSLSLLEDRNCNETSFKTAEKQETVIGSHCVNSLPTERSLTDKVSSVGLDNVMYQHNKYSAERTQAQLKSYVGYKAEEIYVYRSLPLGQDRRRNRYWQFVASASRNDPGGGRIFIELYDGRWRLIDSEEAFDALLMSLDTRGIRECHLHSMLLKIETSFKENVRRISQCTNILGQCMGIVKSEVSEIGSSPNCTTALNGSVSLVCGSNSDMLETPSFKIQLGKNQAEEVAALERYQDFQRLMCQECFHSLTLCAKKYGKKRCTQLLSICELCLDSFDSENHLGFSEHVSQCEEKRELDTANLYVSESSLPLQIRLLKYLLAFVEVSIPYPAFKSFWENYRKTWGLKLLSSSSSEDLLQVLTLLESAIKKDYLSSNFETTKELLRSSTSSRILACDPATARATPVLPWIPHTTAAVALRLLELDLSISYEQSQEVVPDEDKEVEQSMKHPSSYKVVQNSEDFATTDANQSKFSEGSNCSVPVGSHKSSGCRRGGRGRGRGKAQNFRLQTRGGRRSAEFNEDVNQVSGWDCRVVRRKRTGNRAEETSPDQQLEDGIGPSSSSRMMPMEVDFSSSSSSSGEAEDSDESAKEGGYEVGNWRLSAAGRAGDLIENPSDDDTGSSNDTDNGDDEDGGDDSNESIDASEGFDGMVGVRDVNGYDEVSESAGSEEESSLGASSDDSE